MKYGTMKFLHFFNFLLFFFNNLLLDNEEGRYKMIKSMKNFILILAVTCMWGSFSDDVEDNTSSKTSQKANLRLEGVENIEELRNTTPLASRMADINLKVSEEELEKKQKPKNNAVTYGVSGIIVGSVDIGLGVAGVFSPELSNGLILVGSGFVLGGVANVCYGTIRKLNKAKSKSIK